MYKIQEISIVASFLGLWISTHFSGDSELLLGFALILSFGMLHGANDILLLHKLALHKKTFSLPAILIRYILSILLVAVLFYVLPTTALLGFLLYSAYHFGEQHWHSHWSNASKTLTPLFYFLYGMCVLCLLFLFNDSEVKNIVFEITKQRIDNLHIEPLLLGFGLATVTTYLVLAYAQKTSFKKGLKELFFIGLLALIFKSSSLIWGFAIYFIFWHSIPSLFDQISYLYGNASFKNLTKYCKAAFPYWLVSIIGVAIFYFYFANEKQFSTLFFCFIAAVTFPHAFVMKSMFSKNKSH